MTQRRDTLSEAERLAGHLPGLLLKAEAVAHSFMKGGHGRRRVGMGEAFWQFRPWQHGDNSRDIDWRQTAKREGAFIRQTEWEAAQTAWLYRDMSPSMECNGKREYAEILLLALGMILLSGGEQVGLLGTDIPPQTTHAAMNRLCMALPSQTHLQEGTRSVTAKSQVVIFSDFYFPLEQIVSFCEKLAARRIKGLFVQVYHPAEETLDYRGRVRFQDAENLSGAALDIQQVESVRAVYEEKFRQHQCDLASFAKGIGWGFEKCNMALKPESAMSLLYDRLSMKGG